MGDASIPSELELPEEDLTPDEVGPAEGTPIAAQDHPMMTGTEDENLAVPEGAGAATAPLVAPAAETAGSLPPIEPGDFIPSPSLGSVAPIQTEPLPADPEMVDLFVTDKRLNKLWERADNTKEALDNKVHTLDIARALLNQIMYARNYLLAGRQHYEEAERHVNEAEFRVFQNFQSRRWSTTWGIPILVYELICAAGLVLLFLGLETPALRGFSEDLRGMLAAMIWGGLGGVVGAWLALIKHTSQEQDFDKQHTLWYINSPFMGILLGAFIYWVVRAGLISLTAGEVKAIESPYVIYILAWLAGYQHNVFTAIVRKILKILEVGAEDKEPAKTAEKPAKEPKPPYVLDEEKKQGSEEGPDKRG